MKFSDNYGIFASDFFPLARNDQRLQSVLQIFYFDVNLINFVRSIFKSGPKVSKLPSGVVISGLLIPLMHMIALASEVFLLRDHMCGLSLLSCIAVI